MCVEALLNFYGVIRLGEAFYKRYRVGDHSFIDVGLNIRITCLIAWLQNGTLRSVSNFDRKELLESEANLRSFFTILAMRFSTLWMKQFLARAEA
jgi:hypothetical protein